MKDNTKPPICFFSTPSGSSDHFYRMFMAENEKQPTLIGVDWAAGNGMIRSEVIKKEGNVTHVRFKTVCV